MASENALHNKAVKTFIKVRGETFCVGLLRVPVQISNILDEATSPPPFVGVSLRYANYEMWQRERSYELKPSNLFGKVSQETDSNHVNNDYILGSIKFQHLDSSDMGHRDREFIIINEDDDSDQTLEYLTRKWNLGAPKLVISLLGGYRDIKQVTSTVKQNFRRELVNAVLSTGAWLTTGGLHSGVTKDVGEALKDYAIGRAMAERRSIVAMGIAPLSILKHKQKLISGKTQKYKIDPSDVTNAQLDPNHTHFILVNDENSDKSGLEIEATCKLVKDIAGRMIEGSNTAGVPVVCIVLGGGYRRIKAIHQSVVNDNIPVIILNGSGGAADVLAYACKNMGTKATGMDRFKNIVGMSMSHSMSMSQSLARNAFESITKFNALLRNEFGKEKIQAIQGDLMEACREIAERDSLVTVLQLNVSQGDNVHNNVEENILNALLKAKRGSHYGDQLHLAVVLNKIDLAQQLLKEETCLKVAEVRESMRFALVSDQVKLVRLFLDKGLSLHDYLTARELTSLYKSVNKDTLLYELLDDQLKKRNRRPVQRWVRLRDIGNVIQMLTAWTYQPLYLQENITDQEGRFQNPARELFIWAVLQGRLEIADLFWREGKASIGGALVASKLLKELAVKEHEFHESRRLTNYEEGGRIYEQLAVAVLDECYLTDRNRTSFVIVRVLRMWGSANCLDLAYSATNRNFIAHSAVQNMLKEFWMGKLSSENKRWKIWFCVIFPPALLFIRLKLKDEEADPLVVKSLPRGTSTGEILIRKPVRRTSTIANAKSRKWGLSFLPRSQSKPDGDENEDISHSREGLPVRELNRRPALKMDSQSGSLKSKHKKQVLLPLRIHSFFTVPMVIFLYNVISTGFFLALFSFILLQGLKEDSPSHIEYLLIAWFITLCTEIIRQISREDAETFTHRFVVWISNFWNIVDIAKSIIFIIGLVLRCFPITKSAGRIILAISLIVFYMRLLHIFSANKHLGPKLIMIQKMFADLLVFLCILLVFLVAYGVASEAVLCPGTENKTVSTVFESILYRPYIQMFGEMLEEDVLELECGRGGSESEAQHVWFGTILLAMYLFLSNVLLLNLLIAMFNYTFTAVQANTDVYWKYQRYLLIREYYKRPALPPPFIIINHIFLFIKGMSKGILKVCIKCRNSVYCSCCREKKHFDPDLPPLIQASMDDISIWESVKGEDYLKKERENKEQNINKKIKNMDSKISHLSEQVTTMVKDMSTVHDQLVNMQSLLLDKLGQPLDASESDDSLADIPDMPKPTLFKKSGVKSSRTLQSSLPQSEVDEET